MYAAAPVMAAISEQLPDPAPAADGDDADDDDGPDLLALCYEQWPARFHRKVLWAFARDLLSLSLQRRVERVVLDRARPKLCRRLVRDLPRSARRKAEKGFGRVGAALRLTRTAAYATSIGFASKLIATLLEEGALEAWRRFGAARGAAGGEPPPADEKRLTVARALTIIFEECYFCLSSVVGAGVGTLLWPGVGTTIGETAGTVICEMFVTGR